MVISLSWAASATLNCEDMRGNIVQNPVLDRQHEMQSAQRETQGGVSMHSLSRKESRLQTVLTKSPHTTKMLWRTYDNFSNLLIDWSLLDQTRLIQIDYLSRRIADLHANEYSFRLGHANDAVKLLPSLATNSSLTVAALQQFYSGPSRPR